jgi:hypothetical protein
MPLRKQRRAAARKGGDGDGDDDKRNGFSQERLNRIFNSMQPTMTRHASDEDMERIFRGAEECVWVGGMRRVLWRCLGRVGVGGGIWHSRAYGSGLPANPGEPGVRRVKLTTGD